MARRGGDLVSITRLVLGPVAFRDFEVPERITFGGTQRLAVHELPGGGRVIDVMGAQNADLVWSGVFSGADAAERVRLLDGLRLLAAELQLSWDVFAYTVIIERFEAEYTNPWWIPYHLTCKIVQDPVEALIALGATLVSQVASDLAVAAGFISFGAAQSAIGAPGVEVQGSAANIAAIGAISSGQQAIEAQMSATGSLLDDGSLGESVSACGTLADLGVARGYAGRAAATLSTADF